MFAPPPTNIVSTSFIVNRKPLVFLSHNYFEIISRGVLPGEIADEGIEQCAVKIFISERIRRKMLLLFDNQS